MWKTFNIAFLELLPIVIAVHVWVSFMAAKHITFFSDNAAFVDIINKQTSKHMDIVILLRDLVLSCFRNIFGLQFPFPGREFQENISGGRRASHSKFPAPNAVELGANLGSLLSSSLKTSSRRLHQLWTVFPQFKRQFYTSSDPPLLIP